MSEPLSALVNDLRGKLVRRTAAVGVVGLGVVGSITARLVVSSGFRVIGIDQSAARVHELRGVLGGGHCQLGTDPAALEAAEIVIVAVRAGISGDDADLSAVRSVLQSVHQYARRPVLLLLESTVPPGATRECADACFGAGTVQSALVVHCPERLRVGDDIADIRATPRLLGGLSPQATKLAQVFMEQLGIQSFATSSPEATELTKLFENTFLTTGIALMGEVTRIAHRLGVSAREVASAAATKPHGYFPFQPGAGIGGHCLMNDLRMLQMTAARLGEESEMLGGVHRAAERLTGTVVQKLEALLGTHDIPLSGAVVCVVGVGFKPDSSDTTGTAAFELVRYLRRRGASVVYADSRVPEFAVDGTALRRISTPRALEHTDAVLLLAGDRQVDVASFVACVPVILDAGGGRITPGAQPHAAAL